MQAENQHAMIDMNDYMALMHITKPALAQQMCKEESVIRKQLGDRTGKVTLSTAYEYAEALGGMVLFITDEQYEMLKLYSVDPNRIETAEAEVERLRVEHDQQADQITELSKTVKELTAELARLRDKVNAKDDLLMRKDEILHRLIERHLLGEKTEK